MKVEVTNHKKVQVGSVKPGEVICINDENYLVLSSEKSLYVDTRDLEKRTMLAHLESGKIITPINSVTGNVVKNAKVTLTF